MVPLLYVDSDQVRAALRCAPEDLPDGMFGAGVLERDLALDLDGWLPTHAAIGDESSLEARPRNLLRSYCVNWLALRVLATMPLSLPTQVSDGKNSETRAPNAPDAATLIRAGLVNARKLLEKEVLGLSVAPSSPLVSDTPSYDPVTG